MEKRTCTVTDCEKAPRSSRSDWCKMHYHRWYRHGDVNAVAVGSGISASHGRRYRRMSCAGHPLADKHGMQYVHRVVLFDAIGPGPHACHWCNKQVTWSSTRGDADCLTVDHLNGMGDDNRIENLAASCGPCNTLRAVQARGEALRGAGWWSHHDTVAALGPRSTPVAAHAE